MPYVPSVVRSGGVFEYTRVNYARPLCVVGNTWKGICFPIRLVMQEFVTATRPAARTATRPAARNACSTLSDRCAGTGKCV